MRCLAACIVAWCGACFAVPGNFLGIDPTEFPTEFPSRPQTRAVRTPGPLKKFFIARSDDRYLRPFWLCQALASYDSARRSPDAALVRKKFQNSLKRLSELGVNKCNFPQWDQYMVAKLYSENWVSFSKSRASFARQHAVGAGSELMAACQAALGDDTVSTLKKWGL